MPNELISIVHQASYDMASVFKKKREILAAVQNQPFIIPY